MNPDGHRCQPILGEDGEVVAVARMDPNASPETRAALRNVIEAARRRQEEEMAADPSIADRYAAGQARIRERNRRLRGES